MREYRTLADVTVEYFTNHPDEIDDFLAEIFADYAEDGDSALRIIARVKGVLAMATEVGNLHLDNVNAIMCAMGYQLMPQPLYPQSQEKVPT
jgi:HTH-type transcriptional regulator/antitoxin HigA